MSMVVKSERDQTIGNVEIFSDCCRPRELPGADIYLGDRSAEA